MADLLSNVVEALQRLPADVLAAVRELLSSCLAENFSGCLPTVTGDSHDFLSRNSCARMALQIASRVLAEMVLFLVADFATTMREIVRTRVWIHLLSAIAVVLWHRFGIVVRTVRTCPRITRCLLNLYFTEFVHLDIHSSFDKIILILINFFFSVFKRQCFSLWQLCVDLFDPSSNAS